MASNTALAASSLLHSAADMQLSGMTNFSSLAQVCGQYGSAAAASAVGVSPASFSATADGLYSAAAVAAAASASHNNTIGVGETSSSLSLVGTSSASSTPTTGIASFGFTQEQVACVCEVLEQSGNIDRLAR